MRLLTFCHRAGGTGSPQLGLLQADGKTVVVPAAASLAMSGESAPFLDNALAFLEAGDEAREAASRLAAFALARRPSDAIVSLENLSLLAPLPQPRSIRDGMMFERHVIQSIRAILRSRSRALASADAWMARRWGRGLVPVPGVWRKRPVYYKGNPMSVIGPEAEVRWPSYTKRLDYELEFGIVVGRRGRNIPKAQAKHFIAGYTIFNDFTARDVQLDELAARLGPSKSKDFDAGNVLGPYLVSPDEVPDPYNLTMVARVNGEEWSRGSSRDMAWTFEEALAYISQDETLYPGDFIGSGAVGDGCGFELDRWLKPGDVVELEVEHLGLLRNRVGEPSLA